MPNCFYRSLLVIVVFQIFLKPFKVSEAAQEDESTFPKLKLILERFVYGKNCKPNQVILLTDKKDSSASIARYMQMKYPPYTVFKLPIIQNQTDAINGVAHNMKKLVATVPSTYVIAVFEFNMTTAFINLVDREGTLCSQHVFWVIIVEHEDDIAHLKSFLEKDIQATMVIVSSKRQRQIQAFRFTYDWIEGIYTPVLILHERSCTKFFAFKRPTHSPRKSMEERNITIALEKHFPFFIPPTNNTDSYKGVDIKLLEVLKEQLNFRYNLVRPVDGKWGSLHQGTWDGMIGMVQRQEVDAALGGISLTWLRSFAVSFTTPYAYDRVTFIGRRPKEISRALAILRPFDRYVWISIILSFISVSMIFGMFQSLTYQFFRKKGCKKRGKNKKAKPITYNDSFWFVFRSLLIKEFYSPRDNSSKFIVATWLFCVVTITAGYQGLLTSFMAHPGHEDAIDTVAELVSCIKGGKLSCGTIKDSSDHNIFKTGASDSFRTILKNMESDGSNFVRSDLQGLDLARRKNYVYIAGEVTVDADIKQPELYLFAKESFQHFGYSIALNQRSWDREAFNLAILRIREAGIIDKWISDYIEKNRDRSIHGDDSNKQMTLSDLQGAYLLHGIGIIVSCLAFIYECIKYYKLQDQQQVDKE